MDVKYHVFLSAILALLYTAFSGGSDVAGWALILAVGVGLDVDHIPAYLFHTRNFRAGLLKNTHAHYKRVMDWLYYRKGEPHETLDFMALHNIEVAIIVFFIMGNSSLLLPMAIGYLGHIALDLLVWHRIIFRVGTRTPMQAASHFSLACRLLFGTARPGAQ